MGKKKKTLKQKKLAEARRLTESHGETSQLSENINTTINSSLSYSFSPTVKKQEIPSYSLQNELKKTLFVSLSILTFLVILSVLLQSHAFVLPLVSVRY